MPLSSALNTRPNGPAWEIRLTHHYLHHWTTNPSDSWGKLLTVRLLPFVLRSLSPAMIVMFFCREYTENDFCPCSFSTKMQYHLAPFASTIHVHSTTVVSHTVITHGFAVCDCSIYCMENATSVATHLRWVPRMPSSAVFISFVCCVFQHATGRSYCSGILLSWGFKQERCLLTEARLSGGCKNSSRITPTSFAELVFIELNWSEGRHPDGDSNFSVVG